MKKRVATCELAEDLMSLYDPTKDDDVLKLIIRSPEVAMALGVAYLFNALAKSELSHEYWRMRVIELLIKSDRSEAARLAGDYPREFIWTVGRLQDSDGLATAIELLDPNKQDLDFLSLSAWTFGRSQSEEGLKAIRAVLNN